MEAPDGISSIVTATAVDTAACTTNITAAKTNIAQTAAVLAARPTTTHAHAAAVTLATSHATVASSSS
eukprot:4784412-Pleurochrysis_carterae.AAC.2